MKSRMEGRALEVRLDAIEAKLKEKHQPRGVFYLIDRRALEGHVGSASSRAPSALNLSGEM